MGAPPSAAVLVDDDFVTVEWLEIRAGGLDEGVEFQNLAAGTTRAWPATCSSTTCRTDGILIDDADANVDIYNNIVYSAASGRGIRVGTALDHGQRSGSSTTPSTATPTGGHQRLRQRSCDHAPEQHPDRQPAADYNVSGLNAASSNNLASDATGTTHSPAGAGTTTSPPPRAPRSCPSANCVGFTSITSCSENLHLISTTYTNRRSTPGPTSRRRFTPRHRQPDPARRATWDIGADELNGFTAVKLASFTARGFDVGGARWSGRRGRSWTTSASTSTAACRWTGRGSG